MVSFDYDPTLTTLIKDEASRVTHAALTRANLQAFALIHGDDQKQATRAFSSVREAMYYQRNEGGNGLYVRHFTTGEVLRPDGTPTAIRDCGLIVAEFPVVMELVLDTEHRLHRVGQKTVEFYQALAETLLL